MSEATATTAPKIVWFEIPAADTQRAREFYARLLDWQYEQFGDQDYYAINETGGAVTGVEAHAGVLVYFGTHDIEAAAARVSDLGGRAEDVQTVPGIGSYVHCVDSEGNRFGLFSGEGA